MRTVITVASCALIVVAAPCLAAPQAQPAGGGIDPTPLGAPSIREARRVGIVMLGAGGESARAAATVQAWLESAGKHVVRLRSMPAIPLRPIVANMNQTFHLEVTAFVRILTPGDHSAVAVEFRDAQGEPVQGPGERARELPAIQFALPATPPPSEQDDDDDGGEEPKAIAPPAMLLHTDRGRPYLG